ncbi:MAG: hypothetical protein KKE17_03675 [Proteobacteria bacterium]|nr:hypothetical protein [Pseudomonadota bacterium]MBU1709084.1 hypothetical protein [Pseudomonadota bacterium]
MDTVVIRIGTGTSEEVTWAESFPDGSWKTQSGPLRAAVSKSGRQRLVALVPGQEVFLADVTLPVRGRKYMLQAIPFALEDRLAEDVEELHFAHGRKRSDGSMAVAVVSAQRMAEWRRIFAEGGIEPDVLLPESLALPYDDGIITVCVDLDIVHVRTGIDKGFAVDRENLEALLLSEFEKSGERRIFLYGMAVEEFKDDSLRKNAEDRQGGVQSVMEVFIKDIHSYGELNLLQGIFARHAEWKKIIKLWWVPAVVLGVVVALHGTIRIQEYMSLSAEKEKIGSQIEALYRKTFPDAKKIVNPRAQMESRLNKLKGADAGESNLLYLLDAVGPLFLEAPGYELQNLRYKDLQLDLDMQVKDLKALDRLKTGLTNEAGLDVEIRTASAKGDHVATRLQVRAR